MDQVDHFASLQLLCSKLWLFRMNGFLCDTIIVTNDRTLAAHSVVLAAGSSLFFAAVSASSDDETRYKIFIPHLSGNEVETVLFCIYNGHRCESFEKLGNVDDSYLKNLYGQFGVICLKNAGDHRSISTELNGSSTIEWIVDGKICPEILSVKNAEEDLTVHVQLCTKSDKEKMEDICSNKTEKDLSVVVEEQDQGKDLLLYNPCCQPFTDTLKFMGHKISNATDEATLAHSCDICEQNFQTDCQFRQNHHKQSSISHSLSPRAFVHSHLQDSWTEHLFEEKAQNVEFLYNNFVLSSGSMKDQNKFHEHHCKDSEHRDFLQSRKSFYINESHGDIGNDGMTCCKSDICNLEISSSETGAFKCKVNSYFYPHETKAISYEESKAMNAKSNEYVFTECDKTFKQEYMVTKHQTSHGNGACYVCYVCHQGFSQCHYLQRHLRRHTDEPKYACNVCGKAFREKYLLKKHCLIHASEKPFSCDICGRAFSQDYYLTKHRRRHTDEHNYSCEYCGRAFKENYQLKKHIRVHLTVKKHSCAKCNRLFRDEKYLQKHILIHKDGSVLSCETCGKVFTGQSLLNAHRRSHRSKSSVTCKTCNLTFTLLRELRRHETAEHRLVTTSTCQCQCSECGKLFAHVTQLRSHMKTHSDERPHICSVCQRSFRRRADLRSHFLTHTGQKSNLCNICGKGFLKKSDLKRHFQAHTDERPYVCDTCGKGFKVLSYLKEHIFIHASEKKFICPDCKKAFISIGNLKNHMKIHTGLRPHKCLICGKEFLRPSNLKSHLKIHVKRPEPYSDTYSPLEQILDLENYTLTDASQMLAG